MKEQHEELLRIPGVVAVGIGEKIVGGKNTGRKCIVVYVEKKIPHNQLKRGEIIPRVVDGYETDVVETGEIRIQA